MANRKVKPNYKNITKLVVIVILIICVIVGIKTITYKNSNKYKLKQIGYSNDQITEILKMDKNYIKKLLSVDYNEFLVSLFKEKYFNFDNIDRYLEYHKQHEDMNATDVVAATNVGADYNHYTNTNKTDADKDILMLVNKYNYLDKNYKPDDIMNVKNWYCYGSVQLREVAYDAFIDMFNEAKKEGLTLIITSGYRDYELQEWVYDDNIKKHGQEEADKIAARPGFSEHQTGLTIDLTTYDEDMEGFEATKEFKWMQENAANFGFILRYPENKEEITGYDYESWHYRYVGTDVATKINELGITFDEYYEYYIK